MAELYKGLSGKEAARRLSEGTDNRLSTPRPSSFFAILSEELTEPMIVLLLAVAVGYFVFGELLEALLVLGIILGILFVEVWTEFRAKRAVHALNQLNAPETLVLRDGTVTSIPVETVVWDDVLVLSEGSRVSADAKLLRADDLAIDESPLTGESLPVEKRVSDFTEGAAPAEQPGAVYRGTTVTRGEALARVFAVGRATELGQIADLADTAKPPRTPLQRTLRELARPLVIVALGFAVFVPFLSVLLNEATWRQAILSGLSLAFATIPEELPILVTVVLGFGALRLARQQALVRGLRPAETLGHITAVVSDKTGTLTENRLRLETRLPLAEIASAELESAAFLSLGLAHDVRSHLTDPIEQALAVGLTAADAGMLHQRLPFSRERGWSGAVWRGDDEKVLYLKGEPERVLERAQNLSPDSKQQMLTTVAELAQAGQRVLAVASTEISEGSLPEQWRYLGLLALADPLRPEAAAAVAAVRRAGVKVYLATGDHPEIARSIARQVGLDAERVVTGAELERMDEQALTTTLASTTLFARITPAHKLRLVEALQAHGEIVAMTGDGVNDAPALKAADVGIAMGQGGTDAAREAANLVLTDDRFATLAGALREGRGLFANLQKAVRYYLAVKVGLILVMLLPTLFGLTPPLAPAMIILLELFMDLAASTAFVIERPETALMSEPPRPTRKAFLDAEMRRGILAGGVLLAGAVLMSAWLATLLAGVEVYQTAAFVAWMLGHVVLAFRYRTWRVPLREIGLWSNRVLNLWTLGAVGAALLVSYLPWAQRILGTQPLPWTVWGLTLLVIMVVVGVGGLWVKPRALTPRSALEQVPQ